MISRAAPAVFAAAALAALVPLGDLMSLRRGDRLTRLAGALVPIGGRGALEGTARQ